MVRINLLPWREQQREERKRQFFIALAITGIVGVFFVFLANKYYELEVDNQNIRNQYLQGQIKIMENNLKDIEELKKKKSELLSRMQVIQGLQSNRQILARLLDQFVRTLPEGIFYTSLTKTNKKIVIDGMTVSNNRVSQLMRNFEGSPWLANPNLTVISRLNQKDPNDKAAKFTLLVDETEPKDGEAVQ